VAAQHRLLFNIAVREEREDQGVKRKVQARGFDGGKERGMNGQFALQGLP
jgi:hypothetical protein